MLEIYERNLQLSRRNAGGEKKGKVSEILYNIWQRSIGRFRPFFHIALLIRDFFEGTYRRWLSASIAYKIPFFSLAFPSHWWNLSAAEISYSASFLKSSCWASDDSIKDGTAIRLSVRFESHETYTSKWCFSMLKNYQSHHFTGLVSSQTISLTQRRLFIVLRTHSVSSRRRRMLPSTAVYFAS